MPVFMACKRDMISLMLAESSNAATELLLASADAVYVQRDERYFERNARKLVSRSQDDAASR